MAKAAAKETKAPKEAPSKSGGSKMGLVKLVGFALSMLSAVVVALAVIDFGFDLKSHLHGGEKIAAGLLLVGIVLTAFAGSKAGAERHKETETALEALKTEIADKIGTEFRAKEEPLKLLQADIARKMAEIEAKVEKFLGGEYARLSAENESFRKDVEQRRLDELQRTADEIEKLRAKNLELQERISKWAVEQVEIRIGEDKLNAA